MNMNTMFETMELLTTGQLEKAAELSSSSLNKGAKEVFIGLAKSAGFTIKDINEAWRKFEPNPKARRTIGILEEFRLWLSEGTRTEQEAYDKTIEIGLREESISYIAYVAVRLDEWEMVERTIARLESREPKKRTLKGLTRKQAKVIIEKVYKSEPEESDPEDDSVYVSDEIRFAWDNLKDEMERRHPRKARVHPDKVINLGDTELIKAYTEAFQKLNKKRK